MNIPILPGYAYEKDIENVTFLSNSQSFVPPNPTVSSSLKGCPPVASSNLHPPPPPYQPRHSPESHSLYSERELAPSWMLDDLARSGIDGDSVSFLGIRPVTADEYPALLGIKGGGYSDGYLWSFRDPVTHQQLLTPDGRNFCRVKLRIPRPTDNGTIRYLSPVKGGQHALILPEAHAAIMAGDCPVCLTEGEKKAVAATMAKIPMIGLIGNYGYLGPAGDLLPELFRYVDVQKHWIVIWDSDAALKPQFTTATQRFADILARYGCELSMLILPSLHSVPHLESAP